MKNYDLIVIGTGSGMNYVNSIIDSKPEMKIAVIDKDEPGGICLTRGCIPSKLLLYPAELVREIWTAPLFGIRLEIKDIDFRMIMERMRRRIGKDIDTIRDGLNEDTYLDYYHEAAEFISPYTLRVGEETLHSEMIFLCTGSKPSIPPVKGLEETGYLTSDTVLELEERPKSLAILGGSYIGAEYGHFFSAMGAEVTVIGRNSHFLPQEEPEISELARIKMSEYMKIITNHEAIEVRKESNGQKTVVAKDRKSGEEIKITADEILVATGRTPNTDILHPEKAGIKIDSQGWIMVDKYLETSQPNIWAFGDANGKYLLKHVGNYESGIVYLNAIMKEKVRADYHAVPHAVFSYPEIAGVGMSEKEALEEYGENRVVIGFKLFEDTAKGSAMEARGYFVKVILDSLEETILGAHIIGPHASILIHQIIPLMYAPSRSAKPIIRSMDIHPSLSEVVTRAFYSRFSPEQYHHIMKHLGLED
ncbi:TPA: dihydrolipoyl dehydrogenase [Methanosarcina acetivorans]|uniref:Dihydrolipoamide dehydrogenase n=2 Tax=Methanosarcina acetivorans TaxID=2214 RepID=Q8TQ99_METAC|nr:dihydrolipoyl dehydrogenase [Methanosarcina acetivorans]AAM05060.1 dihydrolipoamide dehydrogenase [Methanosarcina acetivorans C2A]HIH93909.1 dihydrolipoyl dehydrogenase [Methanosarcina acetivorans]